MFHFLSDRKYKPVVGHPVIGPTSGKVVPKKGEHLFLLNVSNFLYISRPKKSSQFYIVSGRFHVTFSLRWTVGHRFRSNFGRAFANRKKSKQPKFQLKKKYFGVSTSVLLFIPIFFEHKLFFAFFATKGLDR